jgi:hypothetical protein
MVGTVAPVRKILAAVSLVVLVVLSACSSEGETPTPKLRQEFTNLGLQALTTKDAACVLDSFTANDDTLLYFLDSPAKSRSLDTADALAWAYVKCVGVEPVLLLVDEELGDSFEACTDRLDPDAATRVVSAALISDSMRLSLGYSGYVECARKQQLSQSLSGRIWLATSATGLAPVVSKEAAICAAEAIPEETSALVDGVLIGKYDEKAAATLADAIVSCAEKSTLAQLVAVSASVQNDCVLRLFDSSLRQASAVIQAYIAQDKTLGDAALAAVRELCPATVKQ